MSREASAAPSTATKTVRLSPADLYRLRRMHLEAQEAGLRAEMARQRLRGVTLALEHRYGLLGRPATIDVHTGTITLTSSQEGSHRDNANGYSDPGAPRPPR